MATDPPASAAKQKLRPEPAEVGADAAAAQRLLAVVAGISGAYDILLGVAMLAGRGLLVRAFGATAPSPAIHADLNGLFLLAIGAGYFFACRRPSAWRAYLWVMGPFLKGAGAALFIADHLLRGSPPAFLVFAVADGALAVVTWWALTRARTSRGPEGGLRRYRFLRRRNT